MGSKAVMVSVLTTTFAIGASIYPLYVSVSNRGPQENAPSSQSNTDIEAQPAGPTSASQLSTTDQSTHSSQAFSPDSPEAVVSEYLRAGTWLDRLRYVKRTPGIEDRMERHYGIKSIGTEPKKLISPPKQMSAIGDIVTVTAVLDAANSQLRYYLERTKDGYEVLWEPSVGWMPIGWDAFISSRPQDPVRLQLLCKLTSKYYPFITSESVKHTHYELEVSPDTQDYHTAITAYVAKDSPAGEQIFSVLRDGQARPMVLDVQFRDRQKEECVWVTAVASDRAYVYDDQLPLHCTSPITVSALPAKVRTTELPFQVSDLLARWIISRDVLGDQVLVVPEARFRITGKSTTPITNLRIKVVYLEARNTREVEILYEDMQSVVGASERPLEVGFSKVVLSKSGKGYKLSKGNLASVMGVITGHDARAEMYYDDGHGFVKFSTVDIQKTVAE